MNILIRNNIFILTYCIIVNIICFIVFGYVETGLIRYLPFYDDSSYLSWFLLVSYIIVLSFYFVGKKLQKSSSIVQNSISICILILLSFFTIGSVSYLKIILIYAFSPIIGNNFVYSNYSSLLIILPYLTTLLGMSDNKNKIYAYLIYSYCIVITMIYGVVFYVSKY